MGGNIINSAHARKTRAPMSLFQEELKENSTNDSIELIN